MSRDTESAVELVRVIAKALVDLPDEVEVEAIDASRRCVIQLSVDPSDLGRVIGKKGRNARSVRVLLGAMGVQRRCRYALEILETD